MKIGINVWSYPKGLELEKIVVKTKEIGYQGIELAIALEDIELDRSAFKERWSKVKDLVASYNLEVPSIATGLFWRFNPIDVNNLDKALKVVELECIAASILGARTILVVPGSAISDLSYEEHYRRAIEFLRKASDIAKDYGIVIGVENVWNRVFGAPYDFYKLVTEVGRENVKAYLDVGNTLPHSIPEHWIDVLGRELIAQIHVKDFSVAELKFGIPLTGDVNWHAVARRLRAIGYDGYVVAEVPPYRGDPFKAAEDTYTSLRKIFG